MNLLRTKAPTFFYFLANQSKQNFVGLKPEIVTSLNRLQSPKKYYEYLLKETPVNSKGLLNLEVPNFMTLINKCKNEMDMNVAIPAYYNFVGHQVSFRNSDVDLLLRKSIECKCPHLTHDLIKNHNYLMYYPQPEVLADIMSFYKENKQISNAKKLIELAANSKLLKFNPRFFESAILLLAQSNNYNSAFLAYGLSIQHKFEISEEAFNALINCLFKASKTKTGKLRSANKLLERLDKYNLTPEQWIKLSFSQLDNPETAITLFESFAEKDFKAERKYILPASGLNKSYINEVYLKLTDNENLKKRFSNALKVISEKYGNNAIQEELRQTIQDAALGLKEAPSQATKQNEVEPKVETNTQEEKSIPEEQTKA